MWPNLYTPKYRKSTSNTWELIQYRLLKDITLLCSVGHLYNMLLKRIKKIKNN